jgi:hypothetical protein
MMRHGRSAGREDGHVGAALPDEAQLVRFDRFPDQVVGDRRVGGRGAASFERGLLRFTPKIVRLRRGGVVAVAIDDHAPLHAEDGT